MGTLRTNFRKEFSVANESEIREFARHIKDFNPLHHRHERAVKAGLQGIIAPGVMTIGFASSALAEEIPEVMVRRVVMEFKTPLYAGSLPTVFCTVTEQRRISANVEVVIKNGPTTVAEGECQLLLPRW